MPAVRGFSLIELVVIIVIAAILAALAIPYFNPRETEAVWFREEVRAALRYAQREAVAQRRSVFVLLPTPAQLRLCYDAACASPLNRITGGAYVLDAPAGVTMSASASPFSFDALGRPSPAGGVTLTVAGGTIAVAAETGYVH